MRASLAHIHDRGFIHRDLKPDNVVGRGSSGDIMLVDFGLAKRLTEDVSARPLDQFTQQMEFVGPVFYASPELVAYASNKSQLVDHRSDMFQFGKVIWFLATGTVLMGVPSRKKSPLGPEFTALVLDLIHDDPDDRPSAMGEVINRLRAITTP